MKNLLKFFSALVGIATFIMSCEHPVRMETRVHEDGSLDKVIELDKADSVHALKNVFNINEAKGWKVTLKRSDSDSTTSRDEFNIRFEKHFLSSDHANQDLNSGVDTLFNIQTKFKKSFRWFYTYIRYSETFNRIDRLKKVKGEDYFNREDQSFINRLPGEGTVISKADSFYLQTLNEKIFKHYAHMGMFLEQLDIMASVIRKNAGVNWVDSLYRQSEYIYNKLEDMEGDPLFAMKMADSLNIPLPKETSAKDFEEFSKDLNSRISFMSFARDGKYFNSIELPWKIVASNADSIAGNKLFWRPLPTKFAVQEFEMYGEARKLNWWAVLISLAIIGVTTYLVFKR